MGMMKRLFEVLQELGYTPKQIFNSKWKKDGYTLKKLDEILHKQINNREER